MVSKDLSKLHAFYEDMTQLAHVLFESAPKSTDHELARHGFSSVSEEPPPDHLDELIALYTKEPVAGGEDPVGAQLFFVGLGYVQGLTHEELLTIPEQRLFFLKLCKDVALRSQAESDILYTLFFETLEDTPQLHRLYAALVQQLRAQRGREWIDIRHALLEPEAFSRAKREDLLKRTRELLSFRDVEALQELWLVYQQSIEEEEL
ncbi:MAG: hypothetical protein CL920_07295 [Deltaproteobacteria bacterium]|nr:hypothetical protein [Deltaproteobacteria bacterium]MBU48482.1 hypothetical protein [Deltaproteobacteria bacterium]|tara:strand:+ start:25372 stop:25989 length:618 start_codon:yes stop_codon:yes gene_type:complete